MELKRELRKIISEEISGLAAGYIDASNEGLHLRVASLKEFREARVIMIYHSVKREPDTLKLVETAFSMGKTVAFPYCYRGGKMEARAVGGIDELHPAVLGIPAPPDTAPVVMPEDLDVIIVPALAFDKNGFRLGYGGGYYDRYLSGVSAFTVGIMRERLMRDELPVEPHDIAVNCVITEERVLCPTLQMK